MKELLLISMFVCIDILVRITVADFKEDKMEREEIQERTNLEIEGMKKRIVDTCELSMRYNEACKECKIGKACKRGYGEPKYSRCNNWESDDVLAAYKLLMENE